MKLHSGDFIVIKIGQENHMIDLYEKGTVYCGTSTFYKTLEDGQLRGDANEGCREIIYEKNEIRYFTIQVADKSKPPVTFQPLRLRINPSSSFTNIYCLYSASKSSIMHGGKIQANKRLIEFGTHYVSFHNSQEFYNRVSSALAQRNLKYRFGLVNYFPKEHIRGNLTGFEKSNDYAWQSEARFFIRNPVEEPLMLNIGSVKDIANLFAFE